MYVASEVQLTWGTPGRTRVSALHSKCEVPLRPRELLVYAAARGMSHAWDGRDPGYITIVEDRLSEESD